MTTKSGEYLKPDECPRCLQTLDAHKQVAGGNPTLPEPGDLSVCVKCGAYLQFDEGRNLRMLSEDEFEALPKPVQEIMEEAQRFILGRNAIRSRCYGGGAVPPYHR